MTTKIRILRDFTAPNDPSGPVPEGTVVEAEIRNVSFLEEPGEAWYVRPDTGEDWYSLSRDYEVVE